MAVQLESAERLEALRDKANAATGESAATLAEAVDALIAGSGDNPLDYAVTMRSLFSGTAFPEGTELTVSFGSKAGSIASEALYYTFSRTTGIKSIKIKCARTITSAVSMRYFAEHNYGDGELLRVDLSGAQGLLLPSSMAKAFYNCNALQEISGEFDMTYCTDVASWLAGCRKLETIRFKAGTIKKSVDFSSCGVLTAESIQSIIDGLADLTGGTAQTLTFHADVGAKLTDAQLSAISAKNWTVTY